MFLIFLEKTSRKSSNGKRNKRNRAFLAYVAKDFLMARSRWSFLALLFSFRASSGVNTGTAKGFTPSFFICTMHRTGMDWSLSLLHFHSFQLIQSPWLKSAGWKHSSQRRERTRTSLQLEMVAVKMFCVERREATIVVEETFLHIRLAERLHWISSYRQNFLPPMMQMKTISPAVMMRDFIFQWTLRL